MKSTNKISDDKEFIVDCNGVNMTVKYSYIKYSVHLKEMIELFPGDDVIELVNYKSKYLIDAIEYCKELDQFVNDGNYNYKERHSDPSYVIYDWEKKYIYFNEINDEFDKGKKTGTKGTLSGFIRYKKKLEKLMWIADRYLDIQELFKSCCSFYGKIISGYKIPQMRKLLEIKGTGGYTDEEEAKNKEDLKIFSFNEKELHIEVDDNF